MDEKSVVWEADEKQASELGWQFFDRADMGDGFAICVFGDDEPQDGESEARWHWTIDDEQAARDAGDDPANGEYTVRESDGQGCATREAARAQALEVWKWERPTR